MKDITDKLVAIGAPLSEEDQVVTETNTVYCCDCVTVNTSLFNVTYRLVVGITFHSNTCKLRAHVEED